MTQKRSRLPGWMPGATSAGATSDTYVGQAPIRARLVSLLLRPTPPPLVVGLGVAASFIVAETLCVYVLDQLAPGNPQGVVYLLGVLVVSTGWGLGMTVLTSLASALAFDYVRNWPAAEPQNWVAIVVFLAVGLLANTLAGVARSRAAEADQRRQEAEVLAEQHAALRRVATLVARGVPPSEVFSAVARELARSLGVDNSALFRYEPDGTGVLLAAYDEPGLPKMPVGERFSSEGQNIATLILSTGRAARMDSHENATGPAAAQIRGLGLRGGVGAPMIVNGRLWGGALVGSSRPEPLPPGTEARVENFADLAATAIANAEARSELTASRARIVAAADDARRRIERDLHDGAQQRLVALGLQLRAVEASVPAELQSLKEQISHLVTTVAYVSAEVQEISRGIHPAILSKGGVGPALKALARRSAVTVELDLGVDRRLPDVAEVAAYYVVAEALTNAAKHARASAVNVCVSTEGANLRLSIRDDGIGGADATKGSGLIGLTDRVEALGGTMAISSQIGRGTSLLVKIPLDIQ
jgi:signal transduction histidine kinase